MPRTIVVVLLGLICVSLMAREAGRKSADDGSGICSHGTIRQTGGVFEAILEVAPELMRNIHAGQFVVLDVRQGQLQGTVKGVRSHAEVTIDLDAARSKIKFSRLQDGQAVIAVIQLEPDCDCELSKYPL